MLLERLVMMGVATAFSSAFGARVDTSRIVQLVLPCRIDRKGWCVEHRSHHAEEFDGLKEDICEARAAALVLYDWLTGEDGP